jgi:hypothetical protein
MLQFYPFPEAGKEAATGHPNDQLPGRSGAFTVFAGKAPFLPDGGRHENWMRQRNLRKSGKISGTLTAFRDIRGGWDA